MSNFIHHILAAAWSFALVAGLLTLASKLWLSRRLDEIEHPAEFDTPAAYIWLVVPGLLPVVWLVSGLIHLDESGALMQACCSVLAGSGASWQQWIFGAGAVALIGTQSCAIWRRWRPTAHAHQLSDVDEAATRVQSLCRNHPRLSGFTDDIRVVDCGASICATVGLFGRRIEIAEALVDRLDDPALEAALLHEVAHYSVHDPARSFVLLLSQIINPFAFVLSGEASAWRFSREIVCDGHAVDCGAEPVSVADAILTAARAHSTPSPAACARLCGGEPDALTARVNLLLNVEQPTHDCSSTVKVPAIGTAILSLGLVLPHLMGARVISFHCLLEETLHTLTFLF